MKMFYMAIATLLFIPYMCAYGIAHLLRINGRKDMPSAEEWFAEVF